MQEAALTEDMQEQGQIMRRALFAILAGGLAHTAVSWIALQLDFYRSGGIVSFSELFTLIWVGHAAFLALIASGLNRRFRDPALTVPLMLWSTLVVLAAAWYVDHVRLCVMVLFFPILQMGVFRIRLRALGAIAAMGIVGYLVIVVLVSRWYPEAIDYTAEMIQWTAFAVMTLGMVVVAAEISSIRGQLAERNRALGGIVERIQDMAIKDELTGLFNRRYTMEHLGKIREMANRGAFELVVAYADLDHFKQINDTYGHQAGDEVLRAFADTAGGMLSGRDFCSRFGGEEFLLVLLKTDMKQASELADRLRREVAALRFTSDPALRVTISIGMATFRSGETLDALLARADEALYEAKDSGRNRICLASEGRS